MRTTATRTRGTARRAKHTRKTVAPYDAALLTFRDDFGITRRMLARTTGLSERSLATWETGGKLNEVGRRAIMGVERLLRSLAEVVHPDAIATWLETPNEAFDGLKPVEVMERGEEDRLWRMIYFLGSGTLS